jgi:hypothetical protein
MLLQNSPEASLAGAGATHRWQRGEAGRATGREGHQGQRGIGGQALTVTCRRRESEFGRCVDGDASVSNFFEWRRNCAQHDAGREREREEREKENRDYNFFNSSVTHV